MAEPVLNAVVAFDERPLFLPSPFILQAELAGTFADNPILRLFVRGTDQALFDRLTADGTRWRLTLTPLEDE